MPTLRQEQKDGVTWIETGFQKYKGVILADRMGLGKTAQAIEVLKRKVKLNPVLIICPSYIVLNWKDELELWNVTATLCIIDSTKQLLHEADIYIVSYDMATKYEFIFKQLFKKKYSLIICDESHYLKSWNSLRSRRILGTKKAKVTNLINTTDNILCLTGTPILNRIEELYNVIIRIAPKALRHASIESFLNYFAESVFYTPWGMKHEGVRREKELKKLLQPVVLSRKKIKGLHDRIDNPIALPLDKPAIQKYIKEEKEYLKKYNIKPDEIYTLKKKDKLEGGKIAEVRIKLALLKIPVFIKALKDVFEKENQVVIYCYHKYVQKMLSEAIETTIKNKKTGIINGTVSMKNRHTIIQDYQDGKIDIILATIGALKEGVNITAGNTVMFLEFDWTPANMEQGIARVWRKGQDKVVVVYYFYFKAGVDLYIMKLLKKKSKTISKIIGG